MVRIGDFLIDRYEASLLNGYKLSHAGQPDEVVVDADCDWEQFRDSDLLPFCLRSVKGVDITGIATSVPRKRVLHTVTWFQAQALCVNAGKRLCTNDEWQVAALGTPDPADPTESLCNIADALPLEAVGHPDAGWTAWGGKRYLTGASPGCVSERGVYDLVGNVWEWVAWWAQAGSAAASVPAAGLDAWPAGWGGDRTYNVNGRANDGTSYRDGLPAAGLRGGGWDEEGTPGAAGVYSLSLSYAPTAAAAGTGFRCCRGGI